MPPPGNPSRKRGAELDLLKDMEVITAYLREDDKFRSFIELPTFRIDCSPLEWWCRAEQKSRYPRLHSMAVTILSIPAESSEPERAFSGSRRTCSWDRLSLSCLNILICLQENLPTISEPGSIFIQDNAPTHKAGIVQEWLLEWAQDNGIELVDWPPYSTDLNPIENAWKLLKEAIATHHPILADMAKNNTSKQRLIEVAIGEWEDLSSNILNKLALSMPNRLEAVIKANGWCTKY